MKGSMFPIIPTGRWGKEKTVTCSVLSYNRQLVRLEIDTAGKSIVLNVSREIIEEMSRCIETATAHGVYK